MNLLGFVLLACSVAAQSLPDESECGIAKGCWKEGQMTVSWAPSNNKSIKPTVDLEISGPGKSDAYVAFGLNPINDMGGAYVFYCQESSSECYIGANQMDSKGTGNHKMNSTNYAVILNHTVTNGQLYCRIRASLDVPSNPFLKNFPSLNTSLHLLIAYGTSKSTGVLAIHAGKYITSNKTNVAMSVAPLPSGGGGWLDPGTILRLKKAHGSLMLFAWVFAMTTAVLTARYFKSSAWGSTLVGGKALWFQIHRGLNYFGVGCTVLAFILIFVALEGKWGGPTAGNSVDVYQLHCLFGLLCSVLGFSQPLVALIRPGPTGRFRPVFNWWHRVAGLLAWTLAAATLWEATNFPYLGNQSTARDIFIAFWVILGFAVVSLEAHYWIFVNHASENSYDLSNEKTEIGIKFDIVRSVLYCIIALIAFTMAIGFIVMIGKFQF